MKRVEKLLWVMIILYTLIRVLSGELMTLLFLPLLVVMRIIIWRIEKNAG